jgi:hypothetical protein
MLTAHVALVSEESKITMGELTNVAGALSKQIARDFGPIWEVNADVAAYARLVDMPPRLLANCREGRYWRSECCGLPRRQTRATVLVGRVQQHLVSVGQS